MNKIERVRAVSKPVDHLAVIERPYFRIQHPALDFTDKGEQNA